MQTFSSASFPSSAFADLRNLLRQQPRTWLVTGVAGFIGSNLLEALLALDQHVVGLDNFCTGHQRNLDETQALVTERQWARFRFIEGDIQDPKVCLQACQGVDYVLHQAALGSVPMSLRDPVASNATNVGGFVNMMVAARTAQVKSFTYAASSSTYGDNTDLPKVEESIGRPLSPYAVTKYVNELYGDVFARCYGVHNTGLRYFNVFGRRQDPNGAYAAVIPQWTAAMIADEPVHINGDGETTRDFCFVSDVVQANLLAATTLHSVPGNPVYNIGGGTSTTLNTLYRKIHRLLLPNHPHLEGAAPIYRGFREGDIRHSVADIGKARNELGFAPKFSLEDGLKIAMPWYEALETTA